MENRDCKLIFVQLGSPKSLEIEDIKTYLREFLSNRKVVDIHPFIWKPILEQIILRRRPHSLKKRYEKIWDGKEFLLVKHTRELFEEIKLSLDHINIETDYAFLYGQKTFSDLLKQERDIENKRWLIMPLFPQYSFSTWGLAEEIILKEFAKYAKNVDVQFLNPFYKADCYIDNIIKLIKFKNSDIESSGRKVDQLLVSFHGLPVKQVTQKKDPYNEHCRETFKLIRTGLADEFKDKEIVLSFQSKFGPGEWLGPYTDAWLGENGKGKISLIVSPSFIADSLETLVEIKGELKQKVKKNGGHLYYINCLNSNISWIKDFSKWLSEEIGRLL